MSTELRRAIYDERGVLVAYVTGTDAASFRVVDTREPAPSEQDLMVHRLNQKLREVGMQP